jgi:excinuclease ABC subunit C
VSIEKVLEFLNGNYGLLIKDLEDKMKDAAQLMEFEAAAEYRDLLNSVKQITQKQKITSTELEDRDIIALATAGNEAVVQVFFIRNGKLIGRDHFYLTGASQETKSSIITSFIKQFYAGTPFVPRELIIGEGVEEKEILEEWLTSKRGQKVYIKVPVKGEKEKLVELARKNASLVLQQDTEKIKREEAKTIGALKQLSELLEIPGLYRVEAFDISNISGFESVGSMIVYENGKPKRNDYRKFKIKWVKGPDDYASMEEVLTRRFTHGLREEQELKEKMLEEEYGSFNRYPDLILMDGGKGQVNIALKVLNKLNMNMAVCGMVKDDNHRTRGLYYNNQEIPIDKNSEAFKLITRIQDETHRFAIEYHRQLRGKTQVHSILDDIEGIGEKRRRALMKHFQSLDEIKAATMEELAQVENMNKLAAKQVYDFFH